MGVFGCRGAASMIQGARVHPSGQQGNHRKRWRNVLWLKYFCGGSHYDFFFFN